MSFNSLFIVYSEAIRVRIANDVTFVVNGVRIRTSHGLIS